MKKTIVIEIDPSNLDDLSGTTSIVFDAIGRPLDDWLSGLCIDIDKGRVQVRGGKGYGDYFIRWQPPFTPIIFERFGRKYLFCLKGEQGEPAEEVDVDE